MILEILRDIGYVALLAISCITLGFFKIVGKAFDKLNDRWEQQAKDDKLRRKGRDMYYAGETPDDKEDPLVHKGYEKGKREELRLKANIKRNALKAKVEASKAKIERAKPKPKKKKDDDEDDLGW